MGQGRELLAHTSFKSGVMISDTVYTNYVFLIKNLFSEERGKKSQFYYFVFSSSGYRDGAVRASDTEGISP